MLGLIGMAGALHLGGSFLSHTMRGGVNPRSMQSVGSVFAKMLPGVGPLASLGSLTKMIGRDVAANAKRSGLHQKLLKADIGWAGKSQELSSMFRVIAGGARAAGKTRLSGEIMNAVSNRTGSSLRDVARSGSKELRGVVNMASSLFSRPAGWYGRGSAGTNYLEKALTRKGIYHKSINSKIHSSTSNAFEALTNGKKSANLLMGPSLGSNLAAISIPSLTGIGTTVGLYSAAKRAAGGIYRGDTI